MLQVDHGRRLEPIDGRLHLIHEVSTRPEQDRPAGYRLVRAYRTATGPLCLWRRTFPVHPVEELNQ